MTDRELKLRLKNVYALSESLEGKRFTKRYEKRSLRILEIIKLEFRYMGLLSIISGVLFAGMIWAVAKTENLDLIWEISSMIPICAMVPTILLSRSERYGMFELEASTRFSLRFIRLVRMLIIGVITMSLFFALAMVFSFLMVLSLQDYLVMIVMPYLISDLGAMIVARKWHRKDNVIGIMAVCLSCCFLPFSIREIINWGQLPDWIWGIGIMSIIVLVIREWILYVRESENLIWNLY